ncbi:hypothetical protein GWN91_05160, partial [Candidatus Saccharibacteria bacterium]|nr:hypothetical protein [Candidatus Saccharibacteria bacterium]NIV72311.1 hypothetical protein [Calditrichia bacterium]NIW79668.1 hypothetical protein [Calditrichia bacterium]
VLHPQWSPDGKSIAYVTDRGAETEKRKLLFDDYDLGLYHVDSNEIEMITNLDG